MNKGFVILAQNTSKVNYVKCAEALAYSIKACMPDAKVSIITDDGTSKLDLFDKIISLPYGELDPDSDWKLINDWQVYEASPYEYTIKLEADMYIPKSIDYWWDILKDRDVVVSTTIRDFKQEISPVRAYRKFIDENKLPDTYNAITYFKKSETAEKFFSTVRNIFENWEQYRATLICNKDGPATTDFVYALASHIVGVEKTTLPTFTEMSMIHMKQFINGTPSEDWRDVLVYEIVNKNVLRVNTVPQMYPFHYQMKDFCDTVIEHIESI